MGTNLILKTNSRWNLHKMFLKKIQTNVLKKLTSILKIKYKLLSLFGCLKTPSLEDCKIISMYALPATRN